MNATDAGNFWDTGSLERQVREEAQAAADEELITPRILTTTTPDVAPRKFRAKMTPSPEGPAGTNLSNRLKKVMTPIRESLKEAEEGEQKEQQPEHAAEPSAHQVSAASSEPRSQPQEAASSSSGRAASSNQVGGAASSSSGGPQGRDPSGSSNPDGSDASLCLYGKEDVARAREREYMVRRTVAFHRESRESYYASMMRDEDRAALHSERRRARLSSSGESSRGSEARGVVENVDVSDISRGPGGETSGSEEQGMGKGKGSRVGKGKGKGGPSGETSGETSGKGL